MLGIVRAVKAYLEQEGFDVTVEANGLLALKVALTETPALIVLDWMLPRLDDLEFMRRLCQEQRTPVTMLTARTKEHDCILGLELGADDYITKPFSPHELVARVKAVLRRSETQDEKTTAVLTVGSLQLNREKRSVVRAGVPLELTLLEFNLLHTLMSAGPCI